MELGLGIELTYKQVSDSKTLTQPLQNGRVTSDLANSRN